MSQNIHPATRNNNPVFIGGSILIIILLGASIYLFNSKSKLEAENSQQLKQKQQIIDSIKSDRLYIQADYDATSAKIDLLSSLNARMKDTMHKDRQAISELQGKISSILRNNKATQAELLSARDMMELLYTKVKDYELSIAELEKDNAELTGSNKLLLWERDYTVERYIMLKMTASVLHASNLHVEFIHIKNSGKEKEVARARRADEIKITFDIDENRIAETGTKQLYVRIVGPDGKVIVLPTQSGLVNTIDRPGVQYSMLKEVEITKNQPLKNVTVTWHQDNDYQQGSYEVELYNGGYKIGGQKADLK